jgi:CubicO group peptidase (beta-lactamase class C family)
MKRTFILSFLATTFIHFAAFSQNIDSARLDAYFETLFEHNRFMGSVAIARGGELIYSKSVGFADAERGIKTNENTKFRIASISKTFTAVLVLKAVEENRLTLCQTIDKWFPEIGNADKITIEHLLRHQSGLHNFLSAEWLISGRHFQSKTEQEMIKIIKKGGNDFEPNERTVYGNSGFVLLTFILERVYEQPFSEILYEKIVRPIGLKNTRLGGEINTQNNECHSYIFFENNWQRLLPETHASQLLGTGAIISTPTDLVKFSHALFSGKLLSKNSLQQMKTIQDNCQITALAFGMGLIQIPFHSKVGFGHSGGIDRFRSMFVYFPDGDISIAFTSNSMDFSNITIALFSAAYNMPFDIPEFTIFDATDVDLNQFVGVYASQQIPLKITITNIDNQLFGQATGQGAFPLKMIGENKFEFRPSGIVLEFNPEDETMIFRQSGGVFNFVRYSIEIPEFTTLDTTDVDLSQYVGVYASPQIPLKMTITKVENQLFGQGTGQPAFPLEMTEKHTFEFRQGGIVLEFNPTDNTMILRQGGGVFSFARYNSP